MNLYVKYLQAQILHQMSKMQHFRRERRGGRRSRAETSTSGGGETMHLKMFYAVRSGAPVWGEVKRLASERTENETWKSPRRREEKCKDSLSRNRSIRFTRRRGHAPFWIPKVIS